MSSLTFASVSDSTFDAICSNVIASSEGEERVEVNRDHIPTISNHVASKTKEEIESDIAQVKAHLARHREETELFLRTGEYIEKIARNIDGTFEVFINYPPSLRPLGKRWEFTGREFENFLRKAKSEVKRT